MARGKDIDWPRRRTCLARGFPPWLFVAAAFLYSVRSASITSRTQPRWASERRAAVETGDTSRCEVQAVAYNPEMFLSLQIVFTPSMAAAAPASSALGAHSSPSVPQPHPPPKQCYQCKALFDELLFSAAQLKKGSKRVASVPALEKAGPLAPAASGARRDLSHCACGKPRGFVCASCHQGTCAIALCLSSHFQRSRHCYSMACWSASLKPTASPMRTSRSISLGCWPAPRA